MLGRAASDWQNARVSQLAITVVGHDRPGIIARTADILAASGMNLEDSSMTLLRGHFAMTLICAGEVIPSETESALQPLVDDSLEVTVREVPVEADQPSVGLPYLVTVHGADRLGIVARLAGVIAGAGGNITDLTTRLAGDLYVLIAEVDLPPEADVDALRARADRRRGRTRGRRRACVRSRTTICELVPARAALGPVRDVVRAPDHGPAASEAVALTQRPPGSPALRRPGGDHAGVTGLRRPSGASDRGVSTQAFCVDVSAHPKARTRHGLIVLVNAEVVEASRNEKGREGCMSVPDLTGDVKRATQITVAGQLPVNGRRHRDHDRRLRSPCAAARDRPLRRPALPGSSGGGARRACSQGLSRSACTIGIPCMVGKV